MHKANWNDDTFVKKEQLMRTKEYILWKIAKKTGIYYDSQGIKKHFCIPATVRALITYDKFLDSMFVLEDCRNIISSQKMDLFKRNYNWFHQDIVERMAGELLSSDQLKLFHLILSTFTIPAPSPKSSRVGSKMPIFAETEEFCLILAPM